MQWVYACFHMTTRSTCVPVGFFISISQMRQRTEWGRRHPRSLLLILSRFSRLTVYFLKALQKCPPPDPRPMIGGSVLEKTGHS